MKTSIVTGVTGQDGYYLCKLLLEKGHKVIGISRYQAQGNSARLEELISNSNFKFIPGDITDNYFIGRILKESKPDYFYNMAALSHVGNSYEIPVRVTEVNYIAVIKILQEIREKSPKTAFLQASTSELFGENEKIPQNEETRMLPTSPYAIAKFGAYSITKLFRAYGLTTYNSICFNHEGIYRPEHFVTGKIAKHVAEIMHKKRNVLELGNMEVYRDWGESEDYCRAMILMMESGVSNDYVLATGETHSVREFVEEAFGYYGQDVVWKLKGPDEIGFVKGDVRVKVNPEFYRPTEVPKLCGDYSKISDTLCWEPTIRFKGLVRKMMKYHSEKVKNGR